MSNTRKYIIVSETEEKIDKLIELLSTPGVSPVSESSELLQGVRITNYLAASPNEVEVELTQNQYNDLLLSPDVLAISEVSDNLYSELDFRGQKRQLFSVFTSADNSVPESWAMARCSSISAVPPWNNDFTYYLTGSSVDLIVLDTGVMPNHPEWKDSNGNDRLQYVNWSNFAPLTTNPVISVVVGVSGATGNAFYINNVQQDTVYVVKDREGRSGYGYPATSRLQEYRFQLDGITTQAHPFFIGSAIGIPFRDVYVSNNGGTTGTVTLTVFPYNDLKSINAGNQEVMYYWSGSDITMGGIIARTPYNIQSLQNFFHSDANGHGTHCAGTAAGSACGWATDAKIYSVKFGFGDQYGYANNQYGTKLAYDFVTNWHKAKLLNPSLSSRPTVTTNSYGWPTGLGYNFIDVDLKVKQLTDNGIHFLHSAGNSYTLVVDPYDTAYFSQGRRVSSPAYPQGFYTSQNDNPVIDVGALGTRTWGIPNPTYTKAEFSNYGTGVSIYAPGSYIQSAWNTTAYATYQGFPGYGLRRISGTSMACPNVAGVLCTMLDEHPSLTPLQAKQKLLENAIHNAVLSYGSGDESYLVYGAFAGGSPLTLSQYPATFVATTSSSSAILRTNERCYNRVRFFNPDTSFYTTSGLKNGTVFFMNSATDMVFLSACPSSTVPESSSYTIWAESINGLFSNTALAPTPVTLNTGNGLVVASVAGNSDYFTFNVENNKILNKIILRNYNSADNVAWLGIQSGSTWTAGDNPGQMLAQQHFGPGNIDQEILTTSAPYNQGFYTVRVQQLGANTNYTIEFQVI